MSSSASITPVQICPSASSKFARTDCSGFFQAGHVAARAYRQVGAFRREHFRHALADVAPSAGDQDGASFEALVGKPCVIKREAATHEYGQAEVKTEGAPNLVNVRTRQEAPLSRGEEAVIVEYEPNSNVYVVARIDWEA